MKRFILKTLLLLLPITVLAVSMEYLLQHIPNDYVYKKNYLDKHSKEIEILILGGSDVYYGINPVYFPQKAFNASHVSQSLDMDFEIFSKYQNNFSNLQVIILSISGVRMWGKLEKAPDSWRMKNYALYYGFKTKSLKDHSELLNNTLLNNFRRLYEYYFEKKEGVYWSKLGWGTSYRSLGSMQYLEETGKITALGHTVNINSEDSKNVFAENMQILKEFIDFCNHKNVKLIILTTPTYHSYFENLSKEHLNKMDKTMNDFVSKYHNCYYLNWNEDPDFTKEDFHDANHLDEAGAKKLSLKLTSIIDSLKVF